MTQVLKVFMFSLLNTSWGIQLGCSAIVALLLPRRRWTFKILAALSVVADAVEMSMRQGTTRYFYTWWAFRVVELLWLAFTTCHMIEKLHPFASRFHWVPLMLAAGSVIAAGRWENSQQMQLLQAFILLECALSCWLYAFLFWTVRMLPFALGVLLAGEVTCALWWRWQGYHVLGWFFAWTLGMAMLWIADRRDSRTYSLSKAARRRT